MEKKFINHLNKMSHNWVLKLFLTIGLFGSIFWSCNSTKNGTIKIGAILPLSGSMANYGKSSEAALQAMLKVINKERKESGFPLIDLIIEDDQMEVKGGVNAINKLIQRDKVPAIIGPDASSITLGVAPIAEMNKTVIISPASTSSDITNAGDYIFRTVPSGDYEGSVTASLYKELYNGAKLAIMHINNEYAISLKKSFLNSLKENVDILEISYNEKETKFASYLTKIKSAGCKVVYLIGYNEMIQVYQQAKELNLDVKWLGTIQLASQSLIDKIGTPVEGTIFPSWDINIEEIKLKNKEFYDEFIKLSGGLELDVFAANSVDALKVIDEVIGNNTTITSTRIKDELYKIKDFNGITGTFSFDSNGDVNKNTKNKIVKNGKIIDYIK